MHDINYTRQPYFYDPPFPWNIVRMHGRPTGTADRVLGGPQDSGVDALHRGRVAVQPLVPLHQLDELDLLVPAGSGKREAEGPHR